MRICPGTPTWISEQIHAGVARLLHGLMEVVDRRPGSLSVKSTITIVTLPTHRKDKRNASSDSLGAIEVSF